METRKFTDVELKTSLLTLLNFTLAVGKKVDTNPDLKHSIIVEVEMFIVNNVDFKLGSPVILKDFTDLKETAFYIVVPTKDNLNITDESVLKSVNSIKDEHLGGSEFSLALSKFFTALQAFSCQVVQSSTLTKHLT
jgi:hypothetical protein